MQFQKYQGGIPLEATIPDHADVEVEYQQQENLFNVFRREWKLPCLARQSSGKTTRQSSP